ncbi:ribonuclease HI, partial [Dysosmobacter welbionis]
LLVEIFFHFVHQIRHHLHHPVQRGHGRHRHRQHPGRSLPDHQERHRLNLHACAAAAAEVLGLGLTVVGAAAAEAHTDPGNGDQSHAVRRGDGLPHDGVGVRHLPDLVHRGTHQIAEGSLLVHCLVHGCHPFSSRGGVFCRLVVCCF